MELVYDAFKDINNDKQIIFHTIYPFATENINDYTEYFDLKDKSLLTVGSSGDQAINALLKDYKFVQEEFEGVQSISYGKKNSIDKILTYKKGIN